MMSLIKFEANVTQVAVFLKYHKTSKLITEIEFDPITFHKIFQILQYFKQI